MKTGRNQPCPCGSGKKYKKCCYKNDDADGKIIDQAEYTRQKLRKTEGELIDLLIGYYTDQLEEEGFKEAFEEFWLWGDIEPDEHLMVTMEQVFVVWLVFSWNPMDVLEGPGAQEAPGMEEKTLALVYLEAHPEEFDDFQRQYIKEASAQPYSYFQVIAVVPGKSLTLKDLLLNRTVTVAEQHGAVEGLEGSILFTKVVYTKDVSVMLGNFPIRLPPDYHGMFINYRQKLLEGIGKLTSEMVREEDPDLREFFFNVYEYALNPPMPKMVNTDGDPLAPVKLVYQLDCSPAEAFHGLKTLAYGMEEETLLSGAVYDDAGEIERIDFCWQKKGNKKHAQWDNTVMGQINIDKNHMTVEVNSEKRSDAIQKEIKKRLKKRAVYKSAVITSIEEMMKEMRGGGFENLEGMAGSQEDLMQIPEVRQKMAEMAEKTWADWLDTSLPALGGVTPREAAGDPVGRERLEGLFLQWEQEEKRGPRNDFAPDIRKLKQALGMDEGR